MATYTFSGQPVVADDDILENATGGTFVDANGTNIPIYDLNDDPIVFITSNAFGMSAAFKADVPVGYIKFGEVLNRVFADEVAQFAVNAQAAIATADAAAADAAAALAAVQALEDSGVALPGGGQLGNFLAWLAPNQGQWADPPTGTGGGGASTWDELTGKPTTFPPSVHQHTTGQISDASTVGRAVMTAADASVARAAIGAGVPVTGFPGFGTTATTAAPGNHAHTGSSVSFTPASGVTATNVQDAIAQASQMGGGSGVSAVLVWRYTTGSWPNLPLTKPAGVYEVRALGPSYPTSIPSWVGLAADKVPLSYSKVAVA